MAPAVDLKGSFRPVYTNSFSQRILPRCADVGVFDETRRIQLVVATNTNKVILERSEAVFHINEPINCIRAVRLLPSDDYDAIVIGTASSLMCYDIYKNKTVFHRQTPEPISQIKYGTIDEHTTPIIICACGSTIWGIDPLGNDVFWTALGDDITTVTLCDYDADGKNELVVGTSGMEIKVLKNLALYSEISETDPISAVFGLSNQGFIYGLVGGTICLIEDKAQQWKIKGKNHVIEFAEYPDDKHIVCFWQGGKHDVRDKQTGEIVAKGPEDEEIAAVFVADMNGIGRSQLVIAFQSGRVVGVEFATEVPKDQMQQMIRDYGQRKHHMMEELRNYQKPEANTSNNQATIPAGTNLNSLVNVQAETGLCVCVGLTNQVPVRACVVFADGLFESESIVIHPQTETDQVVTQLYPPKPNRVDMHLKVFAGPSSAKQLHVFESNLDLPKFGSFVRMNDFEKDPESYVRFSITLPPGPVFSRWYNDNFFVEDRESEIDRIAMLDSIDMCFMCANQKTLVRIQLIEGGKSEIRCDEIDMCAYFFQSLALYFNLEEANTTCYFPESLQQVDHVIETMDDKYNTNERLQAEWAEKMNVARECVVLGQDLLSIRNARAAKYHYVRLALLNKDMVIQHGLRCQAREQLLENVKILTTAIEQHARLRTGEASARLMREARNAITSENLAAIPRFLQHGA